MEEYIEILVVSGVTSCESSTELTYKLSLKFVIGLIQLIKSFRGLKLVTIQMNSLIPFAGDFADLLFTNFFNNPSFFSLLI